jgi:hypothetical protein
MVFRLSNSDRFVKTYDFHINQPVSVSQHNKKSPHNQFEVMAFFVGNSKNPVI